VGTLWNNSGQQLGQVTFTNETASGWQQANFATAVPITANTVYVASYHTNVGKYSVTENFFTNGVDKPPLHYYVMVKVGVTVFIPTVPIQFSPPLVMQQVTIGLT
jgi:Domain of unknown function (DUF4082)